MDKVYSAEDGVKIMWSFYEYAHWSIVWKSKIFAKQQFLV